MIRTELAWMPLIYASTLLAAVIILWLVGSWRRS